MYFNNKSLAFWTDARNKKPGYASKRTDKAVMYTMEYMGHYPFKSSSHYLEKLQKMAYGDTQSSGTMAFVDRTVLNKFTLDKRLMSENIYDGCNVFYNGRWQIVDDSKTEIIDALKELKEGVDDLIKSEKCDTFLLSPEFGDSIYDCRFEGTTNAISKMKDEEPMYDTPAGGDLYYRNQFLAYPVDGNLVEGGNDIPYSLKVHTADKNTPSVCTCGDKSCNGMAKNGDVAFIEGSDVHLLHNHMMVAFVYKLVNGMQTCQIGYVTVPFTQAYHIANLSGIITEENGGVARLVIPYAYGGDQIKRNEFLFGIKDDTSNGLSNAST